MDPTRSKAPFRYRPLPRYRRRAIMESRVSGPFHLSRLLRQNAVHQQRANHCSCGSGRGLLGIGFFLRKLVRLMMNTFRSDPEPIILVSLVPFHGFLPMLKSLHVAASTLTHSQIFNFARSFPLLEDLSVDSPDNGNDDPNKQWNIPQPSTSPPFTGPLRLFARAGTEFIASRLLSLPNGLHFRKLDLTWHRGADSWCTTALVEECCSTLEYIKIDYGCVGMPAQHLH